MTPLLTIAQLSRRYGSIEALRGIDLQLERPGVYGFLGPNGAGKTTTIKIIAGLLRPSSGRVAIHGIDVVEDPVASRRQLGVMMDSTTFYNHLSARDNLRVLSRLSTGADDPAVDTLLDQVGLGGKANHRVGSYSRGMRQRLGVAAALLGDPRLLILDEPANGLDPAGIAEMRTWLVDFARCDGRAVLLSSHQMGEVERICDHVTIIDQGSIVAAGTTDTILKAKDSVILRTDRVDEAKRVLDSHEQVDSVDKVDARTLRVRGNALKTSMIVQVLSEQSIDVSEIIEERETLEDAFFRLVGERRDVA